MVVNWIQRFEWALFTFILILLLVFISKSEGREVFVLILIDRFGPLNKFITFSKTDKMSKTTVNFAKL